MTFLKRFSDVLNRDMKCGIRVLVLMISGILTGLTVAFPIIGFLEWITIIPAAIVLLSRGSDEKIRLRSIYLDGLLFFYGYYLVCYHFFLSMYPLEFVDGLGKGAAAVVVGVSWLGLSLLQSLMGGAVFLLSAIAFRGSICKKCGILKPLIAAAMFAIFEWSQNFGWWGVPWGKLALGQTKCLVGIQNASWFGSYFITFVLVVVNFLIAYGLLNAIYVKVLRLSAILALSVIVFQYSTGIILWFTNDITEGESVTVACVQGNISATEKWGSTGAEKIKTIYCDKTREVAKNGAQIVLWPETVIPFDITIPHNSSYDRMCRDLAKEVQIYLLVGTYYSEGEDNYNSLIAYSPEGERLDVVYNKRRLVPFGEFVPMKEFFEIVIPPLTDIVMNSDISKGTSTNIMTLGDTDVGCLICFDSIYDGLTFDTIHDGAEIICLSTNDSWFSGSAALSIHNSHAQLRSIESGRYISRCASTGISTIISPRGEILSSVDADTEGVAIYEIYNRDNKTVWYYIGNVFVYLCLTFTSLLLIERIVFAIKFKKNIKNKN